MKKKKPRLGAGALAVALAPARAIGRGGSDVECQSLRCAPNGNGSGCSARLHAGGSARTSASGECAGNCDGDTLECVGPDVCAP